MKKQKLLKLIPTQMAFGLKEACAKTKELRKLRPTKRKKFIESNPIKIIISPKRELFIVDHHHLAYAFLQIGVKKTGVKVVADFSGRKKMSWPRFLRIMKKNSWIHLYDQLGCGPHNPIYLPPDIRGMADDPYRSLVWAVRNEGGIKESKEKFYEFKWAQFLRKKKLLKSRSAKDFKQAVQKAVKLCRSRRARNIPGYVGSRR